MDSFEWDDTLYNTISYTIYIISVVLNKNHDNRSCNYYY